MLKHFSHLNTAVQLLEQYRGEMPFSIFAKSFFAQHKKYGSKDRKRIAHLCYCYFRLGQSLQTLPKEERVLTGLFLCSAHPDELLQHARPEWNAQIGSTIDEKISVLNQSGIHFSIQDIFPWKSELSEGIDHEAFCRSFLVQPDLFLRLRPGQESNVREKLRRGGISFTAISPTCVSLPNTSKIDEVIALDSEAVVQDLNSQNTGSFFAANFSAQVHQEGTFPPKTDLGQANQTVAKKGIFAERGESFQTSLSAWDCCAASGGKSILAYDLLPGIQLTVSDIRESIIQNLKARFARAGVKNYRALVIDLATGGNRPFREPGAGLTPDISSPNSRTDFQKPVGRGDALDISSTGFDLIICDAPCSGSGTWSRTPEQLAFFHPDRIEQYAVLQKTILSNIIPHLAKNGRLVYITCSVFKKENVDAVDFIRDKFSLQPERMEVLKGYDQKADTLFAASFT
ncbi:MAG TPA: Fmu (Sun) domain-containing protein [Chitinophagaceae bacterium]|nr:Fmu (Sun) domain-containing protein [Chitinophagaceae bacterium]